MPGCLISDQRLDAALGLSGIPDCTGSARGTKRVDLIIMNEEAAQHKTPPRQHHHRRLRRYQCFLRQHYFHFFNQLVNEIMNEN